jgi:hypothetical protein
MLLAAPSHGEIGGVLRVEELAHFGNRRHEVGAPVARHDDRASGVE